MIQQCILIDDSQADLFVSRLLIRKAYNNCAVVEFKNGQEALEYFNRVGELKNTLIFIDINMPVMNGFELLDELKNFTFDASVKFFMLSSSNSPEDIDRVKQYNQVSNYFIKPLSQEQLKALNC